MRRIVRTNTVNRPLLYPLTRNVNQAIIPTRFGFVVEVFFCSLPTPCALRPDERAISANLTKTIVKECPVSVSFVDFVNVIPLLLSGFPAL